MKDSKAIRATPWLLFLLILLLAYQFFAYRPRWEYRTGKFGAYEDEGPPHPDLASELEKLGDEGWEVISFETLTWDNDREPVEARLVLRRRLRGP